MAQLGFDASNVKPYDSLEPIPPGVYHARIVESEVKPTKANDGYILVLTLEILDGQYAGRKVFDRLNLQNPNPTATEIGQRKLSSYCHATGVIMVQDSQQLHGIPMNVKVKVRTDSTGQYEPSNDVVAVKHIQDQFGSSSGTPTAPVPPQPTAPPQGFAPPQPPMQQSAPPSWVPQQPPQQPPQGFGPAAAPPGYVPQQPTVAGAGAPPFAPGFAPQQPQQPQFQQQQQPPQGFTPPQTQGGFAPPAMPTVPATPPWAQKKAG